MKIKEKKYFNSGKMNNEIEVWNNDFRFSCLNEELKKYEDVVLNDYKDRKLLSKNRKDLYKLYSGYTHNSFINCYLNSYTYEKNPKKPRAYNVWGEFDSRNDDYLKTLCQLNLFTCLYFFHFLKDSSKLKFENKGFSKFWKDACFLYVIFREYYFEFFKNYKSSNN